MRKGIGLLSTFLATLAFAVGCTVHSVEAPPVTGPSEFSLSLRVTAIPDSISQDGASQASISVLALGANGQPLSALVLRMDMAVGGVLQDFGTLAARTLVTRSDGTATTVYTAPPRAPANLGGSGTVVSIVATPTGTNYQTARSQFVEIRLVPPGVILPPADTPTPRFSFSPSPVQTLLPVVFDASTSCAGSTGCTSPSGIVSFAWSFGDGTAAGTGQTISHTFRTPDAFNVTLTVTNDRGISASTTQTVSVSQTSAPTADFTFSPAAPNVNQDINFVATATSGVPGHNIVSYDWNFGSGNPQRGQTVTKSYDTAGTYSVTLTVADDLGNQRTAVHTVSVSSIAGGGLTAAFTISPAAPSVGATVFFNASSSTGSPVRYDWDFGDGVTASGSSATQTHVFSAPASYIVRLTIVDAAGRTNSVTQSVTVALGSGTAPTATFTFSPNAPGVGDPVFFNASTSIPGAGHSIVSYAWTFGDGSAGSGIAPQHAYMAAGSYSVLLKVTDEIGQSTTSSATTVSVGSPPSPTANFTFSPLTPVVGDQVVFDASSSTTAQGQTIFEVAWNFGDGTAVIRCPGDPSCTGPGNRITAHTFNNVATFVVNLVVTDSAFRTGSKSASVPVASPNPTARLTLTKSGGLTITADGSASTAVGLAQIVTYSFNFGDGSTLVSAAAVVPHTYMLAGTYGVTLTVTDNHVPARSGTTTASITVP